jgi:hypothetical protein
MAVHNGIVDGGENAPAIEEGVGARGGRVRPDDLAGIVDAEGLGAATMVLPKAAKGSSRVV